MAISKKTPSSKKVAKKVTKKVTKKIIKKVSGEQYSLVIVESPSKAKTIKKYLGRGFQVVASNGHIKDLPKSKLGVDVKKDFAIELVPIAGKKDKLKRVQELAKDAQVIYLAPDPDREGEAIAYHLAEEIPQGKKKIFRVLFNEITKNAVKAAINAPLALDQNKYDSQKTRRVLDRLVGYKISPILWDKVQRGLSAGRVQSVALRIIVEREEEIKIFVPEQWFSIHGKFAKGNTTFEARFYGQMEGEKEVKMDLKDPQLTNDIVKQLQGQLFEVREVKKKERRQNPSPPFTTSKLQQEGANKLGFTAKKTMMVAQKLYEGISLTDHGLQGLITYMRTDSVRTAAEALGQVREYIGKKYGANYLPAEAILYKRKKEGSKIQDAHEAIRPTNLNLHPEEIKGDLDTDEYKLYSLIWNKFVASQMSAAIIDQTTVTLGYQQYLLRASGSVIKFPGFRTLYLDWHNHGNGEEDGEGNEGVLPNLEVGEQLLPVSGPSAQEHWTAPPPRYNEASIVKDLEEKGIGRPSTYASIISNIQDRGYVVKVEKNFLPTELGSVVCKMLITSFPKVMDVEFTAHVEELLDDIEDGQVKWKKVLKDFWSDFEKTLNRAKDEMKNLKRQEIPTGISCLKCKTGEYHIKWGKNGQFLACSNYPECNSTQDFRKHLDGQLEIVPKEYGRNPCPTCGARLVVKKGKFGRFLTCEEYPQCKTTLPYTIEVVCPECKQGQFAEKKSRYGKFFYGCTNYPQCNNALWSLPVVQDCPACGYPVMCQRTTKRDGDHLECPKCRHKLHFPLNKGEKIS